MKSVFHFTAVRQADAWPIALGSILLPLGVVWLVGQCCRPTQADASLLWGSYLLLAASLAFGYRLLKTRALDEVVIELGTDYLQVTRAAGQTITIPLAAIQSERYWVWRGAHSLLLKTQGNELKLITSELLGGRRSTSQFAAMVQCLRQLRQA